MKRENIDWLRFGFLTGFLIIFVIASLVNGDATYGAITSGFNFITTYFGGFVQITLVIFWLVALFVATSKLGNVRIGGKDAKVEMSTFSWYGIIITTMLAGGGVFYAAAEPFYHFINVPTHFTGVEAESFTAAGYAVALGAFNWGYLVWGATAFCIPLLAYAIYEKGLPNRASSLLYLIGGEKAVNGIIGKTFDILSLIAVAAGTIGPTGFLGLQIAFGLNVVWGIPNNLITQITVILVAAVIFVLGAATGLKKGMDLLSKMTMYLALLFAASILLLGTGMFVIDNYVNSLGIFIENFFTMAFSRLDPAWMGSWTTFYQVWFLSYAPSMAVLALSMSKGRSLREVMLGISVICPLITGAWFAIFGGSAIGFEMANPGVLTEVLNTSGLPGVLLSLIQNLPGTFFMMPLAFILIILFLVTTGSGAAYSMAVQATGMDKPYAWVNALIAALLGVVAVALVIIGGDNAMSAMQNFIVICAMPLVFFYVALVPSVLKAGNLLYQNKSLRIDDK